jgi:hypothetical protein
MSPQFYQVLLDKPTKQLVVMENQLYTIHTELPQFRPLQVLVVIVSLLVLIPLWLDLLLLVEEDLDMENVVELVDSLNVYAMLVVSVQSQLLLV